MATLTSNISNVSLTVSGNTPQSSIISWSSPTVPAGGTVTACTLTGKATANMNKGSATIKVNGSTVSSGSSFTVNLGTGSTATSVSATVVGSNKNASGTVTLSNLVYTVTYTEPVVTYTFRIKENGNWTNVSKIYKKVSDVWVEQDNSSWPDLFNTNTSYIKCGLPTAILYEDGTFIFSSHDNIDISHGNIVSQYIGWESESYNSSTEIPWDSNQSLIQKIYINNIKANSTSMWFNNCDNLLYANINGLNNVTTMYSMFYNCSNLTSLDLSSFDTSNVTNMRAMFYNCSNLTSLDLSSFDTSNVTNMRAMFRGCSNLTSLDLSSFDTSNVTDMYTMFYNCSNLTSLDLSNFNTSNVTNMSYMFDGCSSLTSLDLSSFDMSGVTSTGYMFRDCTNLTTIYVKDETAKTKIESSTNFPSTATVIIGKPN